VLCSNVVLKCIKFVDITFLIYKKFKIYLIINKEKNFHVKKQLYYIDNQLQIDSN